MKTKICSKCGEVKNLNKFVKSKGHKFGVHSICKECKEKYLNEWRKNNYHRFWSARTLIQHKGKGFSVKITKNELENIAEKTKYCLICDCKLDWKFGTGLNANSPTLDRINNQKTLTLNNVQIICSKCNRIKSNMSMNEFIEYCKMIYKKF